MADHTTTHGSAHPISAVVGAARRSFTGLVDQATWSLSSAETRDLLIELTALAAQVTELQARVLTHGEATGATTIEPRATSTAAWLAGTTRTTKRNARAATRLAVGLAGHDLTRTALACGDVLADQAAAIIEAVETLPELPEVRDQCEEHLILLAADHDANDLKILGRRVLAVVDPDAADAHEAVLLAEEEAAAEKKTRFSMGSNGDGTHTGRFTIPDLHADMVKKILMGFAAPKHLRSQGETYDYNRPSPERLGAALCEFIERYPIDQVPNAGGTNATVVVLIDLETLLGGVKPASLDTGSPITAATARRMACEAGIIPAVLGGKSKVLDLGRKARFHTEAQRLAIAIAQKHCQHPLCDTPAWLCHVHHTTPWSEGGSTNTQHAQLLCPRHHTLAHREPPDPPMRT